MANPVWSRSQELCLGSIEGSSFDLSDSQPSRLPVHGRGASLNPTNRFERIAVEIECDDSPSQRIATQVFQDDSQSIISQNDSPDVPFRYSINPYRGCEHGCIYCYARPTHAYLGHSPGLDFETRLYAKVNAAELLEQELSRRGYEPKTIALGAVTDPYQPIEREHGITRKLLEVLERTGHPVGIVTKSAGIVRDIDILARMASRRLVKVAISVTTLDARLARAMEPRAATPSKRIETIERLASVGIPVTVMVAPIVPALNDMEIERILERTHTAGAREAGYVVLRLPLELKDLFREWLAAEYPDRAKHVINVLRSMHGGKDYVAAFGLRQKGTGPYADQIAARFRLAIRRLGMNERSLRLRTDQFRPPVQPGGQLALF